MLIKFQIILKVCGFKFICWVIENIEGLRYKHLIILLDGVNQKDWDAKILSKAKILINKICVNLGIKPNFEAERRQTLSIILTCITENVNIVESKNENFKGLMEVLLALPSHEEDEFSNSVILSVEYVNNGKIKIVNLSTGVINPDKEYEIYPSNSIVRLEYIQDEPLSLKYTLVKDLDQEGDSSESIGSDEGIQY